MRPESVFVSLMSEHQLQILLYLVQSFKGVDLPLLIFVGGLKGSARVSHERLLQLVHLLSLLG